MKIAIVGSGISGLTCSYYLHKAGHDIHLFEANDYIGGHTHTVDVEVKSGKYAIDTGFIVFNNSTYPHFIKLLKELNVKSQATDMSFSVYAKKNDLQYAGGSFGGLFAQRKNLIKPQFYNFLFEIARFQKYAKKILLEDDRRETLDTFLLRHDFSKNLRDYYLYPLISALWSTPPEQVGMMPVFFVANFFYQHALLKMIPDLPWQVIHGGSVNYVKALVADFKDKIFLQTPVTSIKCIADKCKVFGAVEELGVFDKVIVATHSDQALALLAEPTTLQSEILSCFSYQSNDVILHADAGLMPPNQRAWASWNYLIDAEQQQQLALLTYHMNSLQGISAPEDFFVSLNAAHLIKPEKILRHFVYSHPQYTPASMQAQARHAELNHNNAIYFCGAYWGFGFHEDGVNSALSVCEKIMRVGEDCG